MRPVLILAVLVAVALTIAGSTSHPRPNRSPARAAGQLNVVTGQTAVVGATRMVRPASQLAVVTGVEAVVGPTRVVRGPHDLLEKSDVTATSAVIHQHHRKAS